MEARKSIVFIINPISGTHNKRGIIRLISERINKSEVDYSIALTQYAGHASELAAQAVAESKDVVVAIGGDGTINEVGRSLIGSRTALGIIPCGSGNGLARHLHIPLDASGALDIILAGFTTAIDYGIIDGRPFFCTCGVGFDAFVSKKFADSGKRGMMSYIENTLSEGLSYQPETYEITSENGSFRYNAFLIACANASQYGNNAYIAPRASLTDGEMNITVLEPFSVMDIPSLAFQLFNKTIEQNSHIKTLTARKITIHRGSEGVFHFDGDPIMGGKDLVVEIIPSGLNVVVPEHPKETFEMANISQYINEFISFKAITDRVSRPSRQLMALNQQLLRKLAIRRRKAEEDKEK